MFSHVQNYFIFEFLIELVFLLSLEKPIKTVVPVSNTVM